MVDVQFQSHVHNQLHNIQLNNEFNQPMLDAHGKAAALLHTHYSAVTTPEMTDKEYLEDFLAKPYNHQDDPANHVLAIHESCSDVKKLQKEKLEKLEGKTPDEQKKIKADYEGKMQFQYSGMAEEFSRLNTQPHQPQDLARLALQKYQDLGTAEYHKEHPVL